MLTTDEMASIIEEVATGSPIKVTGPEAEIFRKQVEADIAQIQNRGWQVDIPPEWPE